MTNTISDYLKTIGKRGGDKTKQRGTEYYKAIGRAGALKRWGDVSRKNLRSKRADVNKWEK